MTDSDRCFYEWVAGKVTENPALWGEVKPSDVNMLLASHVLGPELLRALPPSTVQRLTDEFHLVRQTEGVSRVSSPTGDSEGGFETWEQGRPEPPSYETCMADRNAYPPLGGCNVQGRSY